MQFSSLLLAAIAAVAVSAQSATSTHSVKASRASNAPANPTMPSNSTKTNPSGTGAASNGSKTTNSPLKVSTAAAPGLLEQAGGVVAVAGMGVAFAVFL